MYQDQKKRKLAVIAGPTAVGKSAAAVGLAKRLDGEIVSADSVQVYRGMDIGSAKVTEEQMQGIPHHLISVLDPHENFDIVRFKQMADEAIDDICSRGRLPVMCGGTGFYIQSVIYGIDFTENESRPDIRARLQAYADEHGADALHDLLRERDPASAEAIHPHNVRKVIRALEFWELSGGIAISEHNARERGRQPGFDLAYFGLYRPRELLYADIDRRVDMMMEQGLLDEVKGLIEAGVPLNGTAMQALGYKELAEHLGGGCSLEEAVEKIKTGSRHYAKRQLTWLRRERNVIWINMQDFASIGEAADLLARKCLETFTSA